MGKNIMKFTFRFVLCISLLSLGMTACKQPNTPGKSSDASLASLAIDSGTLSPAFSASVLAYSATVGNSIETITVSATAANAGATITGTGAQALSVGSNSINVVVKAEDGVSTKTYTIQVSRAAPGASTDATLSSLSLSSGSLNPVFSSGQTSYTASVANAYSSITVYASATDGGALVTGAGLHALPVGDNAIAIVVTAAAGNTKTYTVTLTRTKSSLAYLSSLTVSDGILAPAFNMTITSYTVNVSNSTSTITVGATALNGAAAIAGAGAHSLGEGPNTIDIVVTPEDGGAAATYRLNVLRAAAGASADATLSALSIASGAAIALSPAFGSANYDYTASANYAQNLAYFTVQANDSTGASITAQKSGSLDLVPIDGSDYTWLDVGPNTFTFKVTAADGTATHSYTVVITRAAASNSLSIDSPTSGSTISSGSNVVVTGSFSGATPSRIGVVFASLEVASATITGTTWSASFDTTSLTNGEKCIIATAYDGASAKLAVSSLLPVTLAGGVSGQTISGSFSFAAAPPSGGVVYLLALPLPIPPSGGVLIAMQTFALPLMSYPVNFSLTVPQNAAYEIEAGYWADPALVSSNPPDGGGLISSISVATSDITNQLISIYIPSPF